MDNPFQLDWIKGWTFRIVLDGGSTAIEAYGFGACLRTSLIPGESPKITADKLLQREDKKIKILKKSWLMNKVSLNSLDLNDKGKDTLISII